MTKIWSLFLCYRAQSLSDTNCWHVCSTEFFSPSRLSGLSPLLGDDDNETLANVTAVEWDFDDESFDVITDEAKEFISKLLVKNSK